MEDGSELLWEVVLSAAFIEKSSIAKLQNKFHVSAAEGKFKMTQDERLEYLAGKRQLLRSLMNIRMPGEMPEEVLKIQDEYLSGRAQEKGVVLLSDIPVVHNSLSIWQGDITRLAVDAIVNAANSQMLGCFIPMHTCIDNCIHSFAGVQLRAECGRKMDRMRIRYGRDYEQPTAVPMLTDAYNLPAKKVVHIVGPIVQDELTPELEKDLADCYRNTLDLCAENDLRNRRAVKIAVHTVKEWLAAHPGKVDRVIFNVFKDEDRSYYESELQ